MACLNPHRGINTYSYKKICLMLARMEIRIKQKKLRGCVYVLYIECDYSGQHYWGKKRLFSTPTIAQTIHLQYKQQSTSIYTLYEWHLQYHYFHIFAIYFQICKLFEHSINHYLYLKQLLQTLIVTLLYIFIS